MRRAGSLLQAWPVAALLIFFMAPFLGLKKAFILGDYALQHLPWAIQTFEAARHNQLPLWTNAMALGFPLFAEGQSASLYFLHWIGYRTLPFQWVYSWSVPFHFLVGALGMFFYARKLGLSARASSIASACFCFSSAFAGCFYNSGSLRVLCWLPLELALLEVISRRGKHASWAFAGLCFLTAQQWLGGFPQMAVYAFVYLGLHELLARRWRVLAVLVGASVCGTLLAWPQISATLELIRHSVRSDESLAFALWGSVPPVAPVSLLFPEWGNALRFSFYLGISPLFLAMAAFFFNKPEMRRHAWLAAVFFLLALGRFNPLYAWAVETFHLTALRNPSKFLFFTVTALSVLAAYGYDAFTAGADERRRKFIRFCAALSGVVAALPLLGALAARTVGSVWPRYSQWYVSRLTAEKGASTADAERYQGLMESFFTSLRDLFSYSNFLNLETLLLTLAAVVGFWLFSSKRLSAAAFYLWVGALIVWDLMFFGTKLGIGFTGNEADWASLKPTAQMQRVIRPLRKDPGLLAELVRDPGKELFPPNAGMSYGLRQAGGYSPLLLADYYAQARELGIADSSLGRAPAQEQEWRQRRRTVDRLGIRYLHTDHALDWSGLTLLDSGNDFFLYENTQVSEPVMMPGTHKIRPDSSSDDLRLDLTMETDGVASVRLAAYPGWRLTVDGLETEWKKIDDLFLGFDLKKGEHSVRLFYRPVSWPLAWYLSMAGLVFAAAGAFLLHRR